MRVRFLLDVDILIHPEDEEEVRQVYPTVTEEEFKKHFEGLLGDDITKARVNSVQPMIIEEEAGE